MSNFTFNQNEECRLRIDAMCTQFYQSNSGAAKIHNTTRQKTNFIGDHLHHILAYFRKATL